MSFSLLWVPRRYGVILVDSPAEGEAMDEPGPRIRYTPESGLSSRRVRVYDGAIAEEANVLYDSGWLVGDHNMIDVPEGVLVDQSETYYVQVESQFDDGRPGLSEMRSFTISWDTTNAAPEPTVTKVDMCNAPSTLPRIRVAWDAYSPGASETVVRYLVMRQRDGLAWEHLATKAPDDTLVYFDYEAEAYVPYLYAILPVVQVGSTTRISDLPASPPEVRLEFEGLWLHRCDNPASNMRFDSWNVSDAVTQPIEVQRVWGRRAPVAIVHEQLYHAWSVTGPPAAYDTREWVRLLEKFDEQFSAAGIFVARFGRQRMSAHVLMEQLTRSGSKEEAFSGLRLIEVSVEERFG